MAQPVDRAFPHLTEWVTTHGWIEIGYDDYSRSFVRALDSGGMVWEGQETYINLMCNSFRAQMASKPSKSRETRPFADCRRRRSWIQIQASAKRLARRAPSRLKVARDRSFTKNVPVGQSLELHIRYISLDDALRAADTALGTWIKENFGGE